MDDVMSGHTVAYKAIGQTDTATPRARQTQSVSYAGGGIDLNQPSIVRQVVAEAIGTFAILFIVVATSYLMGGVRLAPQLTYGLAVAAMAATFAGISGGQFNPAVTLGLLVGGRLSLARSGIIIATQITAAVLACLMLKAVFGKTEIVEVDGSAPPTPVQSAVPTIPLRTVGGQPDITNQTPRVTALQGIVLEGALTFFWVAAVYGMLQSRRSAMAGGVVVGFIVAAGAMAGSFLTGGALNPARAFGPALVSGSWENQWIFWVGPMVGGALAGLICGRLLFTGDEDDEAEAPIAYSR